MYIGPFSTWCWWLFSDRGCRRSAQAWPDVMRNLISGTITGEMRNPRWTYMTRRERGGRMFILDYFDATWASLWLKSPATRLFIQQLVQTNREYTHEWWLHDLTYTTVKHVEYVLTRWSMGQLDVISEMQFSVLFYWLASSDLMILPSDERTNTIPMIRQQWFM